MKNKLLYLVKTSLKKKLSSKWFIIINIMLLILVPALINIDNIIKYFGGDFNEPTKVYVMSDNNVYSSFNDNLKNSTYLNDSMKIETVKYDKSIEEIQKTIKDKEKKDVILELNINDNNEIEAKVTTYKYINSIIYQSIVTSINATKVNYALLNSSIDKEELNKIYESASIERAYLTDDLNENEELMNTVGGVLIPIFIVPIFLLVVMVVNMIGAEINEEKTSKSMEIIISSVSPKTHFFSKIISANVFILVQGIIILVSGGLGIILRGKVTGTSLISSFNIDTESIINTFVKSGIFSNIIKAIPFIIIMIILTFLAYSLLAGILSSMTTSMEDYQQLQTPLMLIMLFAYYLAIIASAYESSVFIKIISFIPFVSGILAPVLLIIGQISYVDIIVSTLLLVGMNYILIKYGLKIYKVGILNYSSSELWKKMFKAIKE